MWVFFLPQSHKDRDALNVGTSTRTRMLLSGRASPSFGSARRDDPELASYLRIVERELETVRLRCTSEEHDARHEDPREAADEGDERIAAGRRPESVTRPSRCPEEVESRYDDPGPSKPGGIEFVRLSPIAAEMTNKPARSPSRRSSPRSRSKSAFVTAASPPPATARMSCGS